jgi:tripartite-type tricarboxylate transporter receptor subunit TctC
MFSIKSLAAGLWVAAAVTVPLAKAQEKPDNYPTRPISFVVAYPAGGGMDVAARTMAGVAEQQLSHEFRVENRTGGGGIVGHSYLANEARPDGYAVGVVANPFLFSDFLVREGAFDQTSFEPIAGINFDPVVWVVRSDSELASMDFDGIIKTATDAPGELRVGVMAGNVFQFVTEIVEDAKDVEFEHVPFQGGQPGVTALLRGDIEITNGFYAEVEQYIKNGDLKAVMVSDTERLPFLPDTPAMSELGIDIPARTWGASRFVTVNPETPEDIKAYLASSIYSVLSSDEAKAAFEEVGMTLSPTDRNVTAKNYAASYDALSQFLSGSTE